MDLRSRWTNLNGITQIALIVWSVLLVGVCLRPLFQPSRSNLTQLWIQSANHWLHGRSPYNTDHEFVNFRYGPPAAAVLIPLTWMPEGAAAVVWRLISAGILLSGLSAWMLAATPFPLSLMQRRWVYLLLAPLALGSLNNGQANALLSGLMLWTVVGIACGRWNLAACCLAVGFWFKLYPISLGLLLIPFFPLQLTPRLLGWIGLLGLFPYLTQSAEYVSEMYTTWWEVIRTGDASRRYLPPEHSYRDLLLLCRLWGWTPSLKLYTAIQLVGGVLCFLSCLIGSRRSLSQRGFLLRLFVGNVIWTMLLGPATESNTYILFAPVLCWLAVSIHVSGPHISRYLLGNALGLLYLCVLAIAGPAGRTYYLAAGLQPLAVLLCFAAYLFAESRLVTESSCDTPGKPALSSSCAA